MSLFADATGDHQWIHVDPGARQRGPFGGPIAHGYLTLSLSNLFLPQIVDVQDVSMGVNYGLNKVRFPAPVHVGAKVRGGAELVAAEADRQAACRRPWSSPSRSRGPTSPRA